MSSVYCVERGFDFSSQGVYNWSYKLRKQFLMARHNYPDSLMPQTLLNPSARSLAVAHRPQLFGSTGGESSKVRVSVLDKVQHLG